MSHFAVLKLVRRTHPQRQHDYVLDPKFVIVLSKLLVVWKIALGNGLLGAGSMAHVLVEFLCLCRLPRVIANVTGQLIVLILVVCCTNFLIGWATTSISASFRAVLVAFPPSTFVLHTVQISSEFNLVALLWNLTSVIFLTFCLITLILLHIVINMFANPCICFWCCNLVVSLLVLKSD